MTASLHQRGGVRAIGSPGVRPGARGSAGDVTCVELADSITLLVVRP